MDLELIDRYELKNRLYDARGGKLSDTDTEFWHMVNEMPVACDISGVIRELEDMRDKCLENGNFFGHSDFEKAVEIVKRGCLPGNGKNNEA